MAMLRLSPDLIHLFIDNCCGVCASAAFLCVLLL